MTLMDLRKAEARIAELERQLAAASGVNWTHDAEEWGNALNEAAWTFTLACPEKSALLFNNCKGPLRAAILKYAELVTAALPAQPQGQSADVDVEAALLMADKAHTLSLGLMISQGSARTLLRECADTIRALARQLAAAPDTRTNAQLHGCDFKGWQCYHCGEVFTTVGGAADHFGADPAKKPGCVLKVQLGDERGLLMDLRRAEARVAELERQLAAAPLSAQQRPLPRRHRMADTELLELMARLQIDMLWTDHDVEAMAGLPPHVQIDAHTVAAPSAIEPLGDDPAAAARRAIQRCAAMLGSAPAHPELAKD